MLKAVQQQPGLGRWQATALSLSFVVGSGILVLPVLSLHVAGPLGSLYAWILMTLIGIPLILIFYKISEDEEFTLTRGFTRAFGEGATGGAKASILAALLFGMPAMIYTTASILARFFSFGSGAVGPKTVGLLSHAILTLLCLNHLRPLKKSSQISLVTAVFLTGLIVVAVSTHLGELKAGLTLATHSLPNVDKNLLQACTLSFFGYVGWESFGFFARELSHPKRDLKWVFGISFVFVSAFYLGLAAVVSGAGAQGTHFGLDEGILSLLPSGWVHTLASAVVGLLLLANLNAWVFGGIKQMQETSVTLTPKRRALLAYYLLTSAILLLLDFGYADISDLFLISNQSWILVYGGILAFYFKRAHTSRERVIGAFGTLSFVVLAAGCSQYILVSAIVFGVSYLRHRQFNHKLGVSRIRIQSERAAVVLDQLP